MKHLFGALLLTISVSLTAQDMFMPVIVIDANGKVCYKSPDAKKAKKISTGAVLKRKGEVELKNKANVTMYCDGKFEQRAGKSNVSLINVYPEEEVFTKLNFELTFGDYITSAILLAASADENDGWGVIRDGKGGGGTSDGWGVIRDGKGGGGTSDGWGVIRDGKGGGGTSDGWGVIRDGKGGGGTSDGWGGKGSTLIGIMPFGKVLNTSTTFYWSRPAGSNNYTFSITDKDGKELFTETTKDTSVTVDLNVEAYSVDQSYFWSVNVKGNSNLTSNKIEIIPTNSSKAEEVIAKVEKANLYKNGTPAIRKLMRAVAYENSMFYGKAASAYESVTAANKNNELVRLMNAAFWIRWGLSEKARQIYR